MDYIPGTDLEKLLSSLTPVEKKTISRRIKSALDELRQIPAQGYFGNLERQPYTDGVLSSPDDNPTILGPFENQEQMNQGIVTRLGQKESAHYIRLLRGMVDRTLKGHKIVFTHGDLQPKNIIVECNGRQEDGSSDFVITLIDWNLSGWYPEYWDFCNSTLYCRLKPDWLELVPDILDRAVSFGILDDAGCLLLSVSLGFRLAFSRFQIIILLIPAIQGIFLTLDDKRLASSGDSAQEP